MKDTIAITGGRNFSDRGLAEKALTQTFKKYDVSRVVHGGCSGADRLFQAVIKERFPNTGVAVYKAQWDKLGRKAGPARNYKMIHDELDRLHCLVVFPGGSGTKNCSRTAQKAGVEIISAEDLAELEEWERW